jgi:hypothetical protein
MNLVLAHTSCFVLSAETFSIVLTTKNVSEKMSYCNILGTVHC